MCVLNINMILIIRCNYIHCLYPSDGWKLCLVPVLCGAGMAQVDMLLHVLMGIIDVMNALRRCAGHDILVWPLATSNPQE